MNKKIKIVCLALCASVSLGVASLAMTKMQKANAITELIIPQEYHIEEEYGYGEDFVVPEPSSVRIKTGTVETTAVDVVLCFPDGSAKSAGSYVLNKTGTYTLTYYNANGASATETFVVNKNYYTTEGGATAEYVTDLVGKSGKKGISVSLKDGASFTFNKHINLNDYAGQTLEMCKIFPMFREDPNTSPDASTVSVKLVDCYDSSKFVEFYVWSCGAGQGVYYTGGGASTQVLTGLEYNTARPHIMTEEYEGTKYKIHRPARYQSQAAWGTGIRSQCNAHMLQYDGVTLAWDLSTHRLKVKNGVSYTLVTDLDSAEIYGANAMDFDSFFTTGEVYMNIQAYNYTTTSFQLGIEEIFGESGEALKNSKLVDTKAPEVFVDVEPTVENKIYLQKGKCVTLATVTSVLDLNYYNDMRVEVYRNYGKRGEAIVSVENGTFTPTLTGNYTAVYTAVDSYGNEGKYLLDMVVFENENIVYEEKSLDKLVAAKINVLPVIEASGLNKEVVTTVDIVAPNGERTILKYNGDDGYEFAPAYVGNYTVTYTFKDNVYEEKYSYDVACVDENSATFIDPFVFPTHFMKGASYEIAPVTAYTAGNGTFNENQATVSVSVDGGEYQTVTAAQMKAYKVEANDTIQFKASYGDSFMESKLYSVIDVGYGKTTTEKDYLSYMQGNYTSAALTENGAEYVFAGDAKLQFINVISSKNFKLSFSTQTNGADGIVITLRDQYKPTLNYIAYTYQKSGANVTLNAKQYQNGKLVLDKTIATKETELSSAYTLAYSSVGLNSNDVVLGGVKAFEMDYALLEVSVTNATEGCGITLSRVNNQTFSSSIRESKPQMSYKDCNGALEIDAIQEISPCYASAVLCSVLSKDVKVTVQAPNGDIVTSVDGIRMEGVTADKVYKIKLSQSGQYRVSYSASCIGSTRSNGSETLTDDDYYIINVSEGIAPEIKFEDGSNSQTTIKLAVGTKHTLKKFTVKDNVTASENIKTYTMIVDEGFMMEEDGYNVTSYVFKNKGKFKVCVYAYDELGNGSVAYYNVVVS